MTDHLLKVYGLSFHCPLEKRVAGCPLKNTDGMDLEEKVNWVEKLGLDSCSVIVDYHENCVKNREQF